MPVMPTIGVIAAGNPRLIESFTVGLSELGLVENRDVRIEARAAGGDLRKLPAFATDLLQCGVNLIAAVGAVTARALLKCVAHADNPESLR